MLTTSSSWSSAKLGDRRDLGGYGPATSCVGRSHRRGIIMIITGTIAVVAAAAAALTPANAPEPDPVPAFEQWATDQDTPVDRPACHVDTSNEGAFILCYGLAGDDGAGGYAEIVTAFTVIEAGGEMGTFLPFALSNLDDGAEPAAGGSTFGDGIHIVGDDIAPGTYRSEVTDFCYWARLSGFSGDFDDLITNGTTDAGQVIVEISDTDVGFESSGCGTWEALP